MKVTETIELNEEAVGAIQTIRKLNIEEDNGYNFTIHFYRYFTGNCQLGCIAYANNFLQKVNSDKDIKELFTSLKQQLGRSYPPQFLFDVHQNFAPLVRDYFDVVVDAPYTSTNGSLMNIFIVKSPI